MDREMIIARLREIEATLRARGIVHAALFGSTARGEVEHHGDGRPFRWTNGPVERARSTGRV